MVISGVGLVIGAASALGLAALLATWLAARAVTRVDLAITLRGE